MPSFFYQVNCSKRGYKIPLEENFGCSAKIFFICQSSLLEDNLMSHWFYLFIIFVHCYYMIYSSRSKLLNPRILLPLLYMNTPYTHIPINTDFPSCGVWLCSSELIIFSCQISLRQFQGLANKTWYFID